MFSIVMLSIVMLSIDVFVLNKHTGIIRLILPLFFPGHGLEVIVVYKRGTCALCRATPSSIFIYLSCLLMRWSAKGLEDT